MKRFLTLLALVGSIFASLPAVMAPALAQSTENRDEVQAVFVGSRHSNVYHLPTCSAARRIKPENLIGFKSREEAVRADYRPCKICRP
jgi:methylphosphotriester-DNA--protein-cysteine methyltransferase